MQENQSQQVWSWFSAQINQYEEISYALPSAPHKSNNQQPLGQWLQPVGKFPGLRMSASVLVGQEQRTRMEQMQFLQLASPQLLQWLRQ